MNQITQITSQKNKEDRLNVFVDGSFAFGVEYATAVKFGLKVGVILTQEDIANIQSEEGNTAAFNKGLKYAVKKMVSEKQMVEYLARHGFDNVAIQTAIDKLKEYGYVDDAAFAAAYVSTYCKERGVRRLEFELKNAGVSDQVISEAVSEVDDEQSCARCMQKYLRTHKQVDTKKLVNYLLYRGYDYDQINQCIKGSDI